MVKIDETIRKIAAGMQPTGEKVMKDQPATATNLHSAGDPNCPICHGIGFYRRESTHNRSRVREDGNLHMPAGRSNPERPQ